MFSLSIESGRFAASFYKSWIMAKRTFFSMDENMISFILIGAIALSIIQVCQIDIAYVMLFDMWSKSIKHTFISPVRGYHLIIGSLLFGIIRSVTVFIILMIL